MRSDGAAADANWPFRNSANATGTGTLGTRVSEFERSTILAELERQKHHITNTARALGLERSYLYKKCQQLGIELRSARQGGTN